MRIAPTSRLGYTGFQGSLTIVGAGMHLRFLSLAVAMAMIAGCAAPADQESARLAALEKARADSAQEIDRLRSDVNRAAERQAADAQKIAVLQQELSRVAVAGVRQTAEDTGGGEGLRKRLEATAATIDDMRRKLDRICFYQQPGAGDFLAPCKK